MRFEWKTMEDRAQLSSLLKAALNVETLGICVVTQFSRDIQATVKFIVSIRPAWLWLQRTKVEERGREEGSKTNGERKEEAKRVRALLPSETNNSTFSSSICISTVLLCGKLYTNLELDLRSVTAI